MAIKYIIRERESGIELESFDTKEDAENELSVIEEIDKNIGEYIHGFYELVTVQDYRREL
jgi:hypothetical protein